MGGKAERLAGRLASGKKGAKGLPRQKKGSQKAPRDCVLIGVFGTKPSRSADGRTLSAMLENPECSKDIMNHFHG